MLGPSIPKRRAAGEPERAGRLWRQSLLGYRHVLATQGEYRQARQRASLLQQRLGGAGGGR